MDFGDRPARRKGMFRRLVVSGFAAVVALVGTSTARGDIGIRLSATVVHVGGTLRGWSNGSGFPVYIVPSALAPRRYACHDGKAICEPTSKRAPGAPFVFLGRIPGRYGQYARHHFAFRIPRIRPGRYRVFIYCRPCGRSLIQSGARLEGETIQLLP
jgi:hypothetical protein